MYSICYDTVFDGQDTVMQDAKLRTDNSQHSTRSVVSDRSDRSEDEKKAPKEKVRPPTQSQVNHATDGLLALLG